MNKVIHYIWLGGKAKPRLVEKCIGSWKKYFPDWEIREWNESNTEKYMTDFAKEALSVGKYAFAADSIRFSVLDEFGGLYFDTDVEVLKNFSELTEKYEAFSGFEGAHMAPAMCSPGLLLFARDQGNTHIHHMVDVYSKMHFINPDGTYNQYTIVQAFTEYLETKGLKCNDTLQVVDGFAVFPHEYFCPTDYVWSMQDFTKNTCSIHHYAGSWLSPKDQRKIAMKKRIYKIFGPTLVQKMKNFLRK